MNIDKPTQKPEGMFSDPMSKLPSDFVEVVAVTPNENVKPPMKLTHAGVTYAGVNDSDDCRHYRIPRNYAARLLAHGGGMQFVLFAGEDTMAITQPDGLYTKQIVVMRHTKQKTNKGIKWNPVVIEESGAK